MSRGLRTIVACEVLRLDLEAVMAENRSAVPVDFKFMEIALHRTPQKMPARLAEAIREAEAEGAGEIILAYGLCSHGVAGLSSSCGLSIARCHDCLGLMLGSPRRHKAILSKWPGALYLFDGMMEADFDPLSSLERDYIPRLGEKRARRAMELYFKHYSHFAYIENQARRDPKYKKRFEENCRAFKKDPLEIPSDLEYIRRLVHGPRQPLDIFINLPPGESLCSEDFYLDQRPVS